MVKTIILLLRFLGTVVLSGIVVLLTLNSGPKIEEAVFPVAGNFTAVDVSRSGKSVNFKLRYTKYRENCEFLYIGYYGIGKYGSVYIPAIGFDYGQMPVGVVTREFNLTLPTEKITGIFAVVKYRCLLEPWFSSVKTGPIIFEESVLSP